MRGIREQNFKKDFSFLSGFYGFHVQSKKIPLKNEDVQIMGIKATPHTCDQMRKIRWKDICINSIEYSSSKKSSNVKNLLWAFRCLEAHKENIKEVTLNGIPCYRIERFSKNNKTRKKTPSLRGYIECNKWKPYIEQIISLILKAENNETD